MIGMSPARLLDLKSITAAARQERMQSHHPFAMYITFVNPNSAYFPVELRLSQVRGFASRRWVRTSVHGATIAGGSGATSDTDTCEEAAEGCEEETCAVLVPEAVRVYVQVTVNLVIQDSFLTRIIRSFRDQKSLHCVASDPRSD